MTLDSLLRWLEASKASLYFNKDANLWLCVDDFGTSAAFSAREAILDRAETINHQPQPKVDIKSAKRSAINGYVSRHVNT